MSTSGLSWCYGTAADGLRHKQPRFFARLGCRRLDELAGRLQATPAFQATTPEPEKLTDQLV